MAMLKYNEIEFTAYDLNSTPITVVRDANYIGTFIIDTASLSKRKLSTDDNEIEVKRFDSFVEFFVAEGKFDDFEEMTADEFAVQFKDEAFRNKLKKAYNNSVKQITKMSKVFQEASDFWERLCDEEYDVD